mgnify:CR=1 FL=1
MSDDVPVKITPGEHYMSESQHRRLCLLVGMSEDEIKKSWEEMQRVIY